MADTRVVIIGAGIGGLVCALDLVAAGCRVTVVEQAASVGGKVRQVMVDGASIAAGPTVFTMRDIFDALFARAGARLDDHVRLTPVDILARHRWPGGAELDLFADPAASEAAIGDFAGAAAAAAYRAFRAEAARMFAILDPAFMRAPKAAWPGPLMARVGLTRPGDMLAIRPFATMWGALGRHFSDPRLRQLFARYATYCGSSPFASPATLMVIAAVEARGVWQIDGGIHALASAMQRLAAARGVALRLGTAVCAIDVAHGRASGVRLADGDWLAADAVVANADPAALAAGAFGADVAASAAAMPPPRRSLSALTWLAHARTSGMGLVHHNVLFSDDYPAEFADLAAGRPPARPSVYICAQDRGGSTGPAARARERLQIIVNAPANGDRGPASAEEMALWTRQMTASAARCGLELEAAMPHELTTPADFARMFPSTGGALYGPASHGWAASFRRQGSTTRIPGLYCAGGSTHPGAGVPMAALSGQLAATAVMRGLGSTRPSRPAAMAGGMSMPSATTDATG